MTGNQRMESVFWGVVAAAVSGIATQGTQRDACKTLRASVTGAVCRL
jgi:hypothetical protein